MAMVKLRPGESFDSLLRRFKKQVIKENTLIELKKHDYYVSPSQKRRLKHEAALKRLERKEK